MRLLLANINENAEARRQWLELRRKGVGSSEIAAICGLSSYDTPLQIWAEKTGKVPPRAETEAMWLGRHTEAITAQMFSRRKNLKVKAANALYCAEDESWCLASPDNWVETPNGEKILEAKFTTSRNRRIWESGIPDTYMAQLNWQLGVCDLDFGYIAGLIGGDAEDFKEFEHEFDPSLHEMMQEEGFKFMELVRQDIPPTAEAGDSKLVMRLQGERAAKTVKLESAQALKDLAELEHWKSELYEKRAEVKAAELEVDRFKARIMQHMGSNIYGELPDGRVVEAQAQMNHGYSVKPFRFADVRIKKPKVRESIDE